MSYNNKKSKALQTKEQEEKEEEGQKRYCNFNFNYYCYYYFCCCYYCYYFQQIGKRFDNIEARIDSFQRAQARIFAFMTTLSAQLKDLKLQVSQI
jgi:hypothetical protein